MNTIYKKKYHSLFAISLSIIFLILSFNAAATCLGRNATSTAKTFFKQHYNFYYKNPKKIAKFLSAQFYDALLTEYQCTTKGVICAIETDPWIDAQDGEIDTHKPIIFSLRSTSPTTAIVAISYIFALSKTQHMQKRVLLRLERNSPDTCWLIADLILPSGESLLKIIKAYQVQNALTN